MKTLILFAILILPSCLFSQQIADTAYHPPIQNPEYESGKGPVVFIDEGHYNFHTKDGRYKAFSNLLERDGYLVKAYIGEFTQNELAKGKILVISNALSEFAESYAIPEPSAFTKAEIAVLSQWVIEGGCLFLIADHMPFGDASKALAEAFGFEFSNGFVFDTLIKGPAFFNLKEKTLADCIITKGRDSTESVEQIATFTGQAFKIPGDATSILTFSKNFVNFLPDTAWVFDKHTTKFNAEGWSQGAYKEFGKGKIVVFGEAAMFSAQLAGPQKIRAGMNSEEAPENYQLLLNIIHWLDGKPE